MITSIKKYRILEKSKKNEYISKKIKKLMAEGYPHKQAIAIAYSYWERKQK